MGDSKGNLDPKLVELISRQQASCEKLLKVPAHLKKLAHDQRTEKAYKTALEKAHSLWFELTENHDQLLQTDPDLPNQYLDVYDQAMTAYADTKVLVRTKFPTVFEEVFDADTTSAASSHYGERIRSRKR